uniref:Uncharacterized protein MANES_02G207700 n=2 Tax=Rhizophora mucronata TaxID=61149 RepID=A0A2P2L198_RHIMU
MAEEEVVVAAAASPLPSDHKRKVEDLEARGDTEPSPDRAAEKELLHGAADVGGDSHESKRLRIDVNEVDGLATDENGFEGGKPALEHTKGDIEQPDVQDKQEQDGAPPSLEEAVDGTDKEEGPMADSCRTGEAEDSKLDDAEHPPEEETDTASKYGTEKQSQDAEEAISDDHTTSRKIEVPNDKVGVLIGKGGDTIRYLQFNSGTKIQITRDADADPRSTTRPVELIGTLSSINKAEKLINAVIAEADAGGSPSLVARGLPIAQTTGVIDQYEMQVPNEKVGLIIGRGGDTIKSLQAKSGARIQLVPQHLLEGDGSKERTVRVTGDKKQIEMAREMIKDVMDQTVGRSPVSSGFSQQQSYRPRGPSGPHWPPRGPHSSQPMPYGYQQRGPYSSQSGQYPPPAYGGYPPQQMTPRSNFGWERRPSGMQGPHSHSGGYPYYGAQGGHAPSRPISGPPASRHASGPTPGMVPLSQSSYNYGQPHGPDYGHPTPYSQTAPPQQTNGHRFDEPKYDSHAASQHPYGQGSSQPIYPQVGSQPGYGAQQQYGRQSSYGMPSQAPPPQSYGHPSTSQPGDMSYQGTTQSSQPYGPNVPQQQQYQYPTSLPMQQAYASYGSASGTDGYNQVVAASGPGYPQQGGQPIPPYGQPSGQQAAGYVQGPTGVYGSYPSTQQVYPEQPTPNNTSYGYQASQDPSYGSGSAPVYGAPPSSQQTYTQPMLTQPSYDQSIQQPVAYATTAGSAPAGSTQVYAAPH